jgi:hypothetical protein
MPKVREYLYISRTKLDRFAPPRARRIKSLTAGLGVVGAQGNLSVTAEERGDWEMLHVRLRRAVRSISRAARWYADEEVMPGDWIKFTGEFGYSILDSSSFRIFLMTQTTSALRGTVALLLFGDPANALLGNPPESVDIRELNSYVTNLGRFAQDLIGADSTEEAQPDLGTSDRAAVELFSRIAAAHHGTESVDGMAKVANVINDVILLMPDRKMRNDPAYDITAPLPRPLRLVIASPLYAAVNRN